MKLYRVTLEYTAKRVVVYVVLRVWPSRPSHK